MAKKIATIKNLINFTSKNNRTFLDRFTSNDVRDYNIRRRAITTLKNMRTNGGATLEHFKEVNYEEGYQVGLTNNKTKNCIEALKLMYEYGGNVGLWYSNGWYYVDDTKRVLTLGYARKEAKKYDQQAIFDWKNKKCIDIK